MAGQSRPLDWKFVKVFPKGPIEGSGSMNELLPVLLLGVVAVAFAAGSIGVSNLVGPRRPNPTKLGAYESGNEPLADVPGTRFSVKFYMVAMLFLVFDVEAVFVYPWAVVLRELG